MKARIPLAWLQLIRSKGRLLAAVAGITFAALLMLVHMGVQDALFDSAVLVYEKLDSEIVLTSIQYQTVIRSQSFTERRLHQALGVEGVDSVASLYFGFAPWKNPWTRETRQVFIIAFEPKPGVFELPGVEAHIEELRKPDTVLFDVLSRPEFGPVAETFRREGSIWAEVAGREVQVAGLFTLGTSFGVDGTLITSDLNFLRLFPSAKKGLAGLGAVKLDPDADIEAVRRRLAAVLPDDVDVVMRRELMDKEIDYWANSTPIGFSTLLGVIMGWVVGAVTVYQILYSDVTDHLDEYATLKAMGYSDRYLFGIVMQEALILSVMGFLPSLLASEAVYRITHQMTLLPISMALERALIVYGYTVGMCVLSGLLAARQLRSADPATIF